MIKPNKMLIIFYHLTANMAYGRFEFEITTLINFVPHTHTHKFTSKWSRFSSDRRVKSAHARITRIIFILFVYFV